MTPSFASLEKIPYDNELCIKRCTLAFWSRVAFIAIIRKPDYDKR